MTTTYDQAYVEALALLEAAAPGFNAAVGLADPIQLRHQDNEAELGTPDPSKYWLRFSMQSVASPQRGYQSPDGPSGRDRRVFESIGLVFVQVFAPMSEKATASAIGRALAVLAQAIYRGEETPSGVAFFNVRINDIPNDGKWYRYNVVAEYSFDELG